uniref:E3 20.3K n=1 Tax=Rhabditophanes sp. KR3021 TaxID=114890 RepID=A0AC35TRI2_9BILA
MALNTTTTSSISDIIQEVNITTSTMAVPTPTTTEQITAPTIEYYDLVRKDSFVQIFTPIIMILIFTLCISLICRRFRAHTNHHKRNILPTVDGHSYE